MTDRVPAEPTLGEVDDVSEPGGISRRRFMGYLIAAPTLAVAVDLGMAAPAAMAAPLSTIQPVDSYDLTDILVNSTAPTANLITIVVNKDSTVAFDLPRAEIGQGITTTAATIIADEMDVPVEDVKITLADARPELVFNQFVAGSNSTRSIYVPVRVASAIARGQLLDAAAIAMGEIPSNLSILEGIIKGPGGKSMRIGEVAEKAASIKTIGVGNVRLKKRADLKLLGTEVKRIDARDIVTGRKQFAMDLDVPNALPTMLCRPPTINGKALALLNRAEIEGMPGVTDVAVIPHTPTVQGGVAVRAKTFGQCLDAVNKMKVRWGAGSVDRASDATVLKDLKDEELPMTPPLPGTVIDKTFTFHFRPGDPLETNCAIADVRKNSAEVWSALKAPIWAQEQIALNHQMPIGNVKVHNIQGGGSFGRHLFCDAAFEAVAVSKKIGKPVKLMWNREDNFRHGRVHPMATSRIRVVHNGSQVLALDQRHTSVPTDLSQGFGEVLSAEGATFPGANAFGYSLLTIFALTANTPYNFGPVTQLLNEIYAYNTFNTSSVRNIFSPDVRTSGELMVDELAAAMNKDRLAFRREFIRFPRMRAVLDKVAEVGNYGRAMEPGMAQGIAVHNEYKGFAACLIEIDTRPATVNRRIPNAYTGPRVTKAIFAVDVGKPINALGLKAQMMGGTMDGIAQALTYSLKLKDGRYEQGSWDEAFYTRQWNTPLDFECIVMPENSDLPGGAGELGVAASMAATACAYAKATGQTPTEFPINHGLKPASAAAAVKKKKKKAKKKKKKTTHKTTARKG